MKFTTSRPRRETVVIALHGDGFIEAFAERNVDILIARVPHCPGSEVLAEDTFELMLPERYREVYFPGKARASAQNRPLSPSTIRDASFVEDMLGTLNRLDHMAVPVEGAGEAAASKLARERSAG